MSNFPESLQSTISQYKRGFYNSFDWQVWKWQAIAANQFRYKNLPKTMNGMLIEYFLFYNMQVCVFEDEVLHELFCLPITSVMNCNIYWLSDQWEIIGGNGYHKRRTKEDSVLIFNDQQRSIPFFMIAPWIEKIQDCLITEQQTIVANRVPFVFNGNDKDVNSFNRGWEQVKNGKPFIISRKGTNIINDNMVLQTGVPFIANEVQTTRRGYEAEILSYLGIQNIAQEKAERVNVSEVETLNKLAAINLEGRYATRVSCMKAVNAMFGTNIEVELNEGVIDNVENISPDMPTGAGNIISRC